MCIAKNTSEMRDRSDFRFPVTRYDERRASIDVESSGCIRSGETDPFHHECYSSPRGEVRLQLERCRHEDGE